MLTHKRRGAAANGIRHLRDYLTLPLAAKAENLRDRFGVPSHDPGIDRAVSAAVGWLARAQDNSPGRDGGVPHSFSLVNGWSGSYPETTGYIVPTLLKVAKSNRDETLHERTRRMLDWLVSIQLSDGAFQAGRIDADIVVPVTFNTGQILIGLASGAVEFGTPYLEPMRRAANWLVATQDEDGCWRNHPTPFATPGEKTYETHVAWGLLEAARVDSTQGFETAAVNNVRWALSHQRDNGWFGKCCLTDPSQPLTHTLGYVLRGVIEAYRFTDDRTLLDASIRTADGLVQALDHNGYLPGRLRSDWSPAVRWACLTGVVQIAHCWLILYGYTRDERYRDSAYLANRYVRRTMNLKGVPDTIGGIKGSFPVNGDYGAYSYLNWACKFMIDSNLLEKKIRASEAQQDSVAT